MCGIVGVAESGREADPARLDTALGMLRHRGPEAAESRGFTLPGASVALGHARLRIIDTTEAADGLIANEDETVWVSFNGEIYNFRELRDELSAAGHRFRTGTDTEVLVHLYEQEEGDAGRLLSRLRGMFAFALVDTVRGRVLLARDRLGIKPLYRGRTDTGGLAFASEAGALARSGLVNAGPDSISILGYLRWGTVQGPTTIFAGVVEVPPGSFVEWSAEGERTGTYWSPIFEPNAADDNEERLREALGDSLRRHLVADREVGLFLSGGVDSGAIARLSAPVGLVRALTVTFPDVGGDEGEAAASLARELGVRHDEVVTDGTQVAGWLPQIVGAMDQPTHDGVNSWVVSRAASEVGLVVVLSGLGGDELFGGYPSFTKVPQVASVTRWMNVVPANARWRAAALLSSRRPGSALGRALLAPRGLGPAYCAVREFFSATDLERLGVLRWIDPGEALALFEPPDPPSLLAADGIATLELTHYMRDQLLRDTDQMTMAHSLEARVPLLDDRVVEAALATPGPQRNEEGKALLRRVSGMPADVPKRGFTLPFDKWMRGPLREPLREAVLSEEFPLSWLLERKGREELWRGFERGKVHWSRPWALGVLRLWAAERELDW